MVPCTVPQQCAAPQGHSESMLVVHLYVSIPADNVWFHIFTSYTIVCRKWAEPNGLDGSNTLNIMIQEDSQNTLQFHIITIQVFNALPTNVSVPSDSP